MLLVTSSQVSFTRPTFIVILASVRRMFSQTSFPNLETLIFQEPSYRGHHIVGCLGIGPILSSVLPNSPSLRTLFIPVGTDLEPTFGFATPEDYEELDEALEQTVGRAMKIYLTATLTRGKQREMENTVWGRLPRLQSSGVAELWYAFFPYSSKPTKSKA